MSAIIMQVLFALNLFLGHGNHSAQLASRDYTLNSTSLSAQAIVIIDGDELGVKGK